MKKIAALLVVIILLVGAWVALRSGTDTQRAPETQRAGSFNMQRYSLSDPTSPWVVINKKRPLQPVQYAPSDLVSIGNGQQLRAEAAAALNAMLTAAHKAGYTLTPESGYRSYALQKIAYDSEVAAYNQAYADNESARPGYSEHQSGWAIDLGSEHCDVQDCFGTTPGGKWAIANGYRFGFILRYPAEKTAITGYRNEAWHFRYVGTQLSTEMHDRHTLTLEEFFNLPPAPSY